MKFHVSSEAAKRGGVEIHMRTGRRCVQVRRRRSRFLRKCGLLCGEERNGRNPG